LTTHSSLSYCLCKHNISAGIARFSGTYSGSAYAIELLSASAADAEMDISRALVRAAGSKPGTIRVRGHVPTGVHGDVDVLNTGAGLTVTLATDSGICKTVEFTAGHCRTWNKGPAPGNVVCHRRLSGYDRPQLRLTALYNEGVATGGYRLRFRAGGLSPDETADLAGPVRLTIAGGGIARVGEVTGCTATPRVLKCR
jgi:hypothetical protein